MSFWKPGTKEPGVDLDGTEDSYIIASAIATSQAPSTAKLSLTEFRNALPVYAHKREILYLLDHHNVLVVVGQTGSGKTTQIPQYLYEAGWTSPEKWIACTQPRRIAAISVAERVAYEMEEAGGKSIVGYGVRFQEQIDPLNARIKYMTDGLLFREAMFDPLLSKYSVIMVDEAHERTIHTDLLLGLLKKIRRKRPELRIIICSATLDAGMFVKYFSSGQKILQPATQLNTPAILSLQGRAHPVTVLYLEHDLPPGESFHRDLIIQTILHIDQHEGQGDILVFLTGREEIDHIYKYLLEVVQRKRLFPLPLYAGLGLEQQIKAFEPPPLVNGEACRKVILATNIAESSITIDGIVYVIDTGRVKIKVNDPRTGIDRLIVVPISKASAQQRAGRAGRTRPGKAYRLYSEEPFYTKTMVDHSIPEIQRCAIAPTVMQMKSLGVDQLMDFDLIASPPTDAMAFALEHLYALGALDDEAKLTDSIGTVMAELPVEPTLAKMLIASKEWKCSQEMATIVAMLTVAAQSGVFFSSASRSKTFEEAQRRLSVEEGDLVSFFNIYNLYNCQATGAQKTKWCHRNWVLPNTMELAGRSRELIIKYMRKFGLISARSNGSASNASGVQKCIAAGLFQNAARAMPDGSYRLVSATGAGDQQPMQLFIHPDSVLFRRVPDWVVFYDVVYTTKAFMRFVTIIDPLWLCELAPHYYQQTSQVEGHERSLPR